MTDKGLKLRFLKDNLFTLFVVILAVLATLPLFMILYFIVKQGAASISWEFLVNLPKPVGETGGGVANAIVGTVILIITACCMALPLGITTGVFLSENRDSRLAQWVRSGVEIIQGIPSIVMGIVAYVWIVKPMGGFSAFSGGVALAIMMLPLIIRSTEETLLLTPESIKEASMALGVPYYRTVIKVTVPAGLSGIVTGVLLSVSRIAGETAPLLFTAFGSPYMSTHIMKPVSSLPLIIYNYAISPYPDWHQLAWSASLLLIAMVLVLNITAKLLAKKWKIQY